MNLGREHKSEDFTGLSNAKNRNEEGKAIWNSADLEKGRRDILRIKRDAAIPRISRTYSLMKRFDFPTRKDFMYASYEEVFEHGLDELFLSGLAKRFCDDGSYVTCAHTPDLVDSEYCTGVYLYQHDGTKVVHTMDEVPRANQLQLLNGMAAAVGAIVKVADKRGDHLRKIYVIQHIGPEEDNPDFASRTTNLPIHFHIYATMDSHISVLTTNPQDRSNSRYTFWDPTALLIYELLRKNHSSLHFDASTSSIILREGPLETDSRGAASALNRADLTLLSSLMSDWKRLHFEFNGCFTDFSIDRNGRYVPLPLEKRWENASTFTRNHTELSPASREIIAYMADNLKAASEPDTEGESQNLYKGISGSVGYTLSFPDRKVTLRFAPRVLVSEKYGATDGEFLRFRDRSKMLPEDQIQHILEVQMELIGEMKSAWVGNYELCEN